MKTKLSPSERNVLLCSMDYIRQNPDATTDQLPYLLTRFWAIPGFTAHSHYEVGCVQVVVFMYILHLQNLSEEETMRILNGYRFNRLFFTFQVILAATIHCCENKLPIEPFPIFHIDRYPSPDLSTPEKLMAEYTGIVTAKR